MSRPWMPLYVADYLADTRRLSTLEHGAYMLLIMDYWRNGGLPNDNRKLARIVGMSEAEWLDIRENLAELFQDGWRHKRIDEELAKSEAKTERRAEAGRRGGLAKAANNSSNATILPEQKDSNALASSSQSQPDKTHSLAREPSDGQRYANAVRDVYAIAGQACPDLSPLVAWRKAGWPVEIVCEVIRAKLAANPSKNFTLRYFENAVADAVARSNAPVPIGSANQRAGPSAPREKPMGAAAAILQRDREKSRNERHYAETQPVVIDALPIASGAR